MRIANISSSVPGEIGGGRLAALGKGRGLVGNVVSLLDGKWTSVGEVLGLVVKAVAKARDQWAI